MQKHTNDVSPHSTHYGYTHGNGEGKTTTTVKRLVVASKIGGVHRHTRTDHTRGGHEHDFVAPTAKSDRQLRRQSLHSTRPTDTYHGFGQKMHLVDTDVCLCLFVFVFVREREREREKVVKIVRPRTSKKDKIRVSRQFVLHFRVIPFVPILTNHYQRSVCCQMEFHWVERVTIPWPRECFVHPPLWWSWGISGRPSFLAQS